MRATPATRDRYVDFLRAASIVAVDQPNVTVEAVKKADDDDALVVRLCEVWGARASVRIATHQPLVSAVRTDVLERDVAPVRVAGGQVELDLRPFELATLKLHVTP